MVLVYNFLITHDVELFLNVLIRHLHIFFGELSSNLF